MIVPQEDVNISIEAEEKKSEKPEISGVLASLTQEESRIESHESWEKSVGSWEELRKKYAHLMARGEDFRDKILKIEQKKKTAEIFVLLKETEKTKGWSESEIIYSEIIQAVAQFDIDAHMQQEISARAQKNLEKTHIALLTKEEKNIEKTVSYSESVPLWKTIEKKYSDLYSSSSSENKNILGEQIKKISGKKFLAESYTQMKKTADEKTGKSWKKSAQIYSGLLEKTNRCTGISEKEKTDLYTEISEQLNIATVNLALKEKNFYLLGREKNISKMGYRDSQAGWKKTQHEYESMLRREDLPEKYKNLFETKAKEMQGNFLESLYYGDLEDVKEGTTSDSWASSEQKYTSILGKITGEKNISKSVQHDLQAKASEYQKISQHNRTAKEESEKISAEIETLIDPEKGLDWKDSLEAHKALLTRAASIETTVLSAKRKQAVSEISAKISDNIYICTQKMSREKESEGKISPEDLAADSPGFKQLWATFLATQFQQKNISQYQIQANTNNFEEKKPDTPLDREKLELQEREQKKGQKREISDKGLADSENSENLGDSKYYVDINPNKDVGRARADEFLNMKRAIEGGKKITVVDSQKNLQLNSPETEREDLSKSMHRYIPEISASAFKTLMKQREKQPVLEDEVKKFLV